MLLPWTYQVDVTGRLRVGNGLHSWHGVAAGCIVLDHEMSSAVGHVDATTLVLNQVDQKADQLRITSLQKYHINATDATQGNSMQSSSIVTLFKTDCCWECFCRSVATSRHNASFSLENHVLHYYMQSENSTFVVDSGLINHRRILSNFSLRFSTMPFSDFTSVRTRPTSRPPPLFSSLIPVDDGWNKSYFIFETIQDTWYCVKLPFFLFVKAAVRCSGQSKDDRTPCRPARP